MNTCDNKIDDSCFLSLVFKVVERISRFHRHVRDINDGNEKNYRAHIKELEHCLWIMLDCLANSYTSFFAAHSDIEKKKIFEELVKLYAEFRKFHAELVHLPRPARPVEIIRFCRMLQKGIGITSERKISSNDADGIAIKLSVDIGELPTQEVYNRTPVELFKAKLQTRFGSADTDSLDSASQEVSDCHLAIPRIEVKNPCVWATTAHEIGHIAIGEFYKGSSILTDFYEFVGRTGLTVPAKFQMEKEKQELPRLQKCFVTMESGRIMVMQ